MPGVVSAHFIHLLAHSGGVSSGTRISAVVDVIEYLQYSYRSPSHRRTRRGLSTEANGTKPESPLGPGCQGLPIKPQDELSYCIATEALARQRFGHQLAAELAALQTDEDAWKDYLAEAESTSVADGINL